MRFRTVFRLSAGQIAEALARLTPPIVADISTVARDLQYWKEHFREVLSPERFDAEGEVFAVLESYDYIAGQAIREYRTLPASASARAKMTCLRTAADTNQKKINLLQDLGLVTRELGTLRVSRGGVENAEAIRAWMEQHGTIQDADLVPDAERAWLYGDAAAQTIDAETVPQSGDE